MEEPPPWRRLLIYQIWSRPLSGRQANMTKTELRFIMHVKIPKDELEGFLVALTEKDFDLFHYLADNNATFEPQGLAVILLSQLKKEWKGRHRGEFGGD